MSVSDRIGGTALADIEANHWAKDDCQCNEGPLVRQLVAEIRRLQTKVEYLVSILAHATPTTKIIDGCTCRYCSHVPSKKPEESKP